MQNLRRQELPLFCRGDSRIARFVRFGTARQMPDAAYHPALFHFHIAERETKTGEEPPDLAVFLAGLAYEGMMVYSAAISSSRATMEPV